MRHTGRVLMLDAQQLYLELAKAKAPVWDLSNQQVFPQLLRELFKFMRESTQRCQKALAKNLDAHRLGNATTADFTLVMTLP